MDFVGDDQRIRMLFHELRLEEQHSTPHFSAVWHRANSRLEAKRSWSLLFVPVASLIVLTVCSTAIWLTRWWQHPVELATVAIPGQLLDLSPMPRRLPAAEREDLQSVKSRQEYQVTHQRARLARREKTVMTAARPLDHQDTTSISRWESPTGELLQSPVDEILMSVPELDLLLRK